MRRLLVVLLLACPVAADTTVTLLHFSDYHSHALPFYTDEGERGGIARAIRYLKDAKRRGALIFNGGDTINKGAPAWSDKYQCAEWPWLNGIVDAMAFGNHDADYGREAFEACRKTVRYPILSANTAGLQRFVILESKGKRIGVFAVAGSDFPELVKPPRFSFGDPVAAAREIVNELRGKTDAIVMIGHEHVEADYALAQAVPGIDLIFGTHTHLRRELTKIPGTETWFISPSQYLTYISRVEITFTEDVKRVRGALVPVDERLPVDRKTAKRVARMRRELERDPQYRELFLPVARLDGPLTVDALAKKTLQVMREVSGADVALSTTSSFRGSLPAGTLTLELLRAALPYDNEIVVCTMTGDALQRLLDAATDSYVDAPPQIDRSRSYTVATTDYLANLAHRAVFVCEKTKTGKRVREELRRALTR